MPIIQGIKRVNPLDVNKNVTIGVAFPLDETNMFQGTETLLEQARSNLINTLLTEPGERVNMPDFGCGIKKLLFEQNIDQESLKRKIDNQVLKYNPGIRVSQVETGLNEENDTLFIALSYFSLLDGQTENIQINFN